MKEFIKNIIYFSIFLFIIYIGSIFVIKITGLKYRTPNINSTTGGYGNNLERLAEVSEYNDIDYLFIGSSHAYRGFDPRIFKTHGFSSFNLGSSAQPPFNSYFLLDQYLPILKPKKVIIEVYWGSLQTRNDAIEATVDIVSNKKLTLTDLEMTMTQHHPIAINTITYSYISNVLDPINLKMQTKNKSDKYIKGGFVQRTDTSGVSVKLNKIKGSKTIKYNPYQLKYLDRIATLCKKHDAELILVRAPVSIEVLNTIQNLDEITEQLNEFSELRDISFFDFCSKEKVEQLQLNTYEDFYDGSHLTQSGVEKFNNLLIEELTR